MLKDEGKRRKKIAGTLGWVVVRITQPMPLTSWRAASPAAENPPTSFHKSFRKTLSQSSWDRKICTTAVFLE